MRVALHADLVFLCYRRLDRRSPAAGDRLFVPCSGSCHATLLWRRPYTLSRRCGERVARVAFPSWTTHVTLQIRGATTSRPGTPEHVRITNGHFPIADHNSKTASCLSAIATYRQRR